MSKPERSLVVVVEDDPASRKSLERLLRFGGFDAAVFISSEEFLARELPSGPVALLLDLQLPGLSGLDLLRRLRAQGSNLPVVVLTAHDNPGTREEAGRLGAVAYLQKPCDGRTILDLLRALEASARLD